MRVHNPKFRNIANFLPLKVFTASKVSTFILFVITVALKSLPYINHSATFSLLLNNLIFYLSVFLESYLVLLMSCKLSKLDFFSYD